MQSADTRGHLWARKPITEPELITTTIILSPTLPKPTIPKQYGFHGYGSQSNAFQDYSSQQSSFPFRHQDYVSQTQMGGSSSQRRTDPAMSPINAFPVEELHTPEFSNSFQENTGYWQELNPLESPVEQVATSPPKKKKPSRARQKRTMLKVGFPFLKTTSMVLKDSPKWKEIALPSINLNTNVGDNDEDEVQEIRRPGGRDKARAAGKNKGSKASGSSAMNDDALTRLMVTEMTTQKKEERLAFIEIKKRKVECREREVAAEYRAQQEYIRFYL
ncbi:hypothetical protein Tco_0236455 [Tanacetum coccineum]